MASDSADRLKPSGTRPPGTEEGLQVPWPHPGAPWRADYSQACTGLQGDKPTQESSPGSGNEGAVEEVWGQEAGRAPAPGWGIQSGFLGASA